MSGGTQKGRVFSGDQAYRNALHQGIHLLFVVEGGKQGRKGEAADQARHDAAADVQTAGTVEFQGQISGLGPEDGEKGVHGLSA